MYKEVWWENTGHGGGIRISKQLGRKLDRKSVRSSISIYAIAEKQAKQAAGLRFAKDASKYLARNQVRGAIGITGRVAGRVGVRLVPVVGWAMNAYDAYQVGKWIKEEYID